MACVVGWRRYFGRDWDCGCDWQGCLGRERRIGLRGNSPTDAGGQTGKLTAFIRESAERLSGPQRIELNRFLRVQDGEAVARRGVEVAERQLREGVVGRLIHWLAQHFKELKKVLLEILELIFDLLHIPLPDWIDRILQIMDEFLDLLLSLLSDVFGIDPGRAARELSEQEVNFLRELAALESLKAARAGRRLSAQDEA